VCTLTVGETLDEHRRAVTGISEGIGNNLLNGDRIHPVDPNAVEAVGVCLLCERCTRCLLGPWHRDCPAVVLAEKDDWGVEHAGKVECLVKIALGGRPVAEIRENGVVSTAVCGGHAGAHSVG
jgi:hypothetical protein